MGAKFRPSDYQMPNDYEDERILCLDPSYFDDTSTSDDFVAVAAL